MKTRGRTYFRLNVLPVWVPPLWADGSAQHVSSQCGVRRKRCPCAAGTRPLLSGFEDGADNLIDPQRFEQDTKDTEPFSEHVDRRVPETRHQQRGRHDRKLAHGIQHAEAGATRHAYVQNDDIRRSPTTVGGAREQPEGGCAIARLLDIVASIDEGFSKGAAERVVVIGEKDRCLGRRSRGVVRCRRSGPGRALRRGPHDVGSAERNDEPEDRALTLRALHPDTPPVRVDDALHDRQAKPGTGAALIATLPEAVEDVGEVGLGYARARVRHGEEHVALFGLRPHDKPVRQTACTGSRCPADSREPERAGSDRTADAGPRPLERRCARPLPVRCSTRHPRHPRRAPRRPGDEGPARGP